MKAVKIITKILAIMLIALVGFFGVYIQDKNAMKNQVRDYSFGMDLGGARVVKLKVSDEKETITKDKDGNIVKENDKEENGEYTTEEKLANSDEVKTLENYEKSKAIIEQRLKQLGVNQYVIRLDEETGDIIIEIPENDETDHIASNVSEVGKFEIVDSEDSEKVLMDKSDLKTVSVMYNTVKSETTVYLSFEFNKESAEKLKNITTEYATIKNNNTSTEEDKENLTENNEQNKQKQITMKVDDKTLITTSFKEIIENGTLQLTMGQASADDETIKENIKSASTIATIINTGKLPIKYEVDENEYISTDITKDTLTKLAIIEVGIVLLALVFMAIRYKLSGILAVVEYIGFIAIYLLLIRYTNVMLTLEGIAAIAVIYVLNYVYNYKLLNQLKNATGDERKSVIKNEFIEFCIKAIPICILSIVFCFISWAPISGFGMTMFWGLLLMAIYNSTVTRNFLK